MEINPVNATNRQSYRHFLRQAAVAASVTCLFSPGRQAIADPIILRGDQDLTGMLKGQATISEPSAAPDMMPTQPSGMGPVAGVGAAAVGTAATLGAAHMASANHYPQTRYDTRPATVVRTPGHFDTRPGTPMQMEQGRYDTYPGGTSQTPDRFDRHTEPVEQPPQHYYTRPATAVRTPEHRTYFQQHPKVRATLIGAGVGTAAGAVTGLVTHKGVVRGAAIGAGAGAGVGLIRSSDTLKKHPIVKDMATGAVTGLGLGMASSRHLLGGKVGKLTAVGAAVGLGVGVLRDKLK
jgi:hypothetical protein